MKEYRPRGTMAWMQVCATVLFIVVGTGIAVLLSVVHMIWFGVAMALFFFALAAYVGLTYLGLRAQFITVTDSEICFALQAIDQVAFVTWKYRTHRLPWSDVRAVECKYRISVGMERDYILRTSAGDFVFVHPMWPDAEAAAREVAAFAQVSIVEEDLTVPAPPGTPSTRGERIMRACGAVMIWVIAALILLLLFAMIGAKGDARWEIGKAIMYLGIAAAGAEAMRRYRSLR